MNYLKTRTYPKPCPKCKTNKWKTVVKHKEYKCHKCNYVRILQGK